MIFNSLQCLEILLQISNLSTAFNLANISVAHVMIENQYCGGDKCGAEVGIAVPVYSQQLLTVRLVQVDAASTAVLVGAIMGQLTFGYIGDCLGRPRALQLTMAMSILGKYCWQGQGVGTDVGMLFPLKPNPMLIK